MSVAILVPILNRPHRIEPLLRNIAEATPEPHSVHFAASDEPSLSELRRLNAAYIQDDGGTYPERINALARITSEPFLMCAADDYAFRLGWLPEMLRVMEQFPNSSGIVFANDLYNAAGTAVMVARSYVDELGGTADALGTVFHEGYIHSYCDDELREVAKHRNRCAYARDAIVEHLHVGNGKAPMDDTYRLGEASMSQGLSLFRSRSSLWSIQQ